jgi:hypothetical protein
MLAVVEQYLHEFDTAASRLEALVAREPRQAQAWLTLATLRRLQGRYAASDAACRELVLLRVSPHGAACLAENEGLRGNTASARTSLRALLSQPLDAGTRAWLLTTLAELEERSGNATAAEHALRDALAAARDGYATLAYADLMLAQSRAAEALRLLQGQPRSDTVLLRLARAGDVSAAAELHERMVQAAQRPGSGHAREQAQFALHVQGDARAAVALARENLRHQREPSDLLLLAQAARAARDDGALKEAHRLAKEIGLEDCRLDAPT